jgi:hypothetical protein
MALAQFDEAGRALRRGLELQPELALLPLGLAEQYSHPSEFDAQVSRLAAVAKAKPLGADAALLLGFMEYQRGRHDAAHEQLARLARGARRDLLVRDLLEATRPVRR